MLIKPSLQAMGDHLRYQLSVMKFIQRAQTSSLNAIGGATPADKVLVVHEAAEVVCLEI